MGCKIDAHERATSRPATPPAPHAPIRIGPSGPDLRTLDAEARLRAAVCPEARAPAASAPLALPTGAARKTEPHKRAGAAGCPPRVDARLEPHAERIFSCAMAMPCVVKDRFVARGGRFRLLTWPHGVTLLTGRTLAQGANGKVRLGLDIGTEDLFAIKEASGLQARGSIGRRAVPLSHVVDEVMFVDGLSPVLRCRGTYALQGQPKWGYLMPAMAGTLRELVRPRPAPLPRQAQTAVATRAAQAISAELAQLHRLGWLHGDIKPQNMLFSADGTLCLSDYGNLRPLGPADEVPCEDVCCTIVAPEFDTQDAVGSSFDIFALGWSIWQLFLPKQPFYRLTPGTTFADVLAATMPAQPEAQEPGSDSESDATRGELLALWRQFEAIDAEAAAFVGERMLCAADARCTAAEAANFFAGREVSADLVDKTLRARAELLPVAAEATRLRAALRDAMQWPCARADALTRERHRRLDVAVPVPRMRLGEFAEAAQARSVTLFAGGALLRIVRLSAPERYYAMGPEVAFGAHSSVAPVLYMDRASPMVALTYRDHPTTQRLADGRMHRLEPHRAGMQATLASLSALLPCAQRAWRFRPHHSIPDGTMAHLAFAADATLSHLLSLPSPAARRLVAYQALHGVAEALGELHATGHLHGRLSLEHILVTLADDGALQFDLAGLTGMRPTHPPEVWQRNDDAEYLPPEVAHGQAYGPAADIWALGLCIWQLLEPDLDLSGLRSAQGDIRATMQGTASFGRWHSWACEASDLASAHAPRSMARALGRSLHALVALDRPLAQILSARMLCMVPEGRCTAAEACAFAAARLASLAPDEASLGLICAHMATSPLRSAQRALLQQSTQLQDVFPDAAHRGEVFRRAYAA